MTLVKLVTRGLWNNVGIKSRSWRGNIRKFVINERRQVKGGILNGIIFRCTRQCPWAKAFNRAANCSGKPATYWTWWRKPGHVLSDNSTSSSQSCPKPNNGAWWAIAIWEWVTANRKQDTAIWEWDTAIWEWEQVKEVKAGKKWGHKWAVVKTDHNAKE